MYSNEHAPPRLSFRSLTWRWFAAAVLLAGSTRAAAEQVAPPFLRTADAQVAEAVVRGRDHSATFRAILKNLAASDLIVFVRRGSLFGTTAAATQLVSAAGGYRYVSVTLELHPVVTRYAVRVHVTGKDQ